MKRSGLFAALVVTLVPLSDGRAQGIVIEQRPVPVRIVSDDVKLLGRKAYIPLDDVAQALGSRLEYRPDLDRYSVTPTGGGILAHNPGGVAGVTMPETRGASFAVGDRLVSAGIIIIGGGKPHLSLDDLAAAMNSTLEQAAGEWTLIPRPGAGAGLLGLSEQGIIIIDNMPGPNARESQR